MLQRITAVAARTVALGIAATTLTAATAVAEAGHHDQRADRQNIAEIAQSAGQFNTLLAAARAAGLVDALTGEGPLTVFAPTDAAFAALPDGTVETLLRPENRDDLRRILLYHVVEGRILGADALAAGQASTLAGESVEITLRDGRLTINDSGVIANDIIASNGVIHVIDEVLLPPAPPAPEGRLIIGVFTENADRALRAQLGIERGLVVTRLTDGANAQAAGIRPFDVIAEIDGKPATSDELAEAKERAGFGNTIELTIFRAGKRRTIDVPVGVERH